MIDWETSSLSLLETLEGNQTGFLCASVANPGIKNVRESVQIQVVSENFTALGMVIL